MIKCTCSHCGAKYRLPLEAQGRSARCKKCGNKFDIPREKSLEDSILDWLMEPETEEEETPVEQPRVISLAAAPTTEEDRNRARGPIRMKAGADAPK